MKITMVYAETLDHESHMRVRVTVPKSWRGGPAGRLLDFAVDTYNAKRGGALESSDWHLEVDHRALGTEDVIDAVLRKGDEIRLRPGAARKAGVVAKRSVVAGDCWKERREAHDAHQVAVFDAAAARGGRAERTVSTDEPSPRTIRVAGRSISVERTVSTDEPSPIRVAGRSVSADDPRRGRGVAATRLHGRSAAAASPRSIKDPRGEKSPLLERRPRARPSRGARRGSVL